MKKVIFGISVTIFIFFLVYFFSTDEQKEIAGWLIVGSLGIMFLGFSALVFATFINYWTKPRVYKPNENGDYDILEFRSFLKPWIKYFVNLNNVPVYYVVGQKLPLEDQKMVVVNRVTSGRFGTPPAGLFRDVSPFEVEEPEYPALPVRIIRPDDPIPPLLLEAKNIAQEL